MWCDEQGSTAVLDVTTEGDDGDEFGICFSGDNTQDYLLGGSACDVWGEMGIIATTRAGVASPLCDPGYSFFAWGVG